MDWKEERFVLTSLIGEDQRIAGPGAAAAKVLGPEEIEFRVGWIRECLKAQPDTMCYEFLEDLRRLALASGGGERGDDGDSRDP